MVKAKRTTDPYQSLVNVLDEAYNRASQGKGKERHATGQDFDEQPIVTEGNNFYVYGNLQQIRKKALEIVRLPKERGRDELLDIIVYAAASVIIMDKRKES